MLDLNDFRYFVRIVDCRGLTAASRDLNVPKSTVSHRLQQLEAALGVRLINRTSRSLSVTDAGEHFYRHAVNMLEHARLAENTVRGRLAEPSGSIRFTSAVATSLFALRPILPDFISRYPKIQLVQHTSDDQVDIVGGGYDLAIRAHSGPLSDSMLVQRTLAPAPWYLFASPDYIGRRGLPPAPPDLAQHDTLSMLRPGHAPAWKLTHSTAGEVQVPIAPRFTGNDLMMLMEAARDGLGIVALPSYVCRAEVGTGSLRPVLPDWSAGQASISAVVAFRNGLQPSVRVFLDYLAERIPRIVA
jgi:DNA-binding transcriptional LysR family regulator